VRGGRLLLLIRRFDERWGRKRDLCVAVFLYNLRGSFYYTHASLYIEFFFFVSIRGGGESGKDDGNGVVCIA